ncbi:MAG TPA: peptide chain release factor N(5)-glutamine methyltransferase [Dehalococcoidia bacterium]|nr:peptide chain release factor N(5)-glutamine methyltransferase [Dehalococcoidia bacterium]
MTVQEALLAGVRALREVSDEAHLEAELLLCHALQTDRVHLYQRLQEPIDAESEARYRGLLERRLAHEPTPYILGRREFYGLDLELNLDALIPRPETEQLVERALMFLRDRPAPLVADVGTGSGAIALALAANLPPSSRILAIDSSEAALRLARRNAGRLGLAGHIEFVQADLLTAQSDQLDVIVANLPYVRTSDWESALPEVRHEPRASLDGGPDGLRIIARLLEQAPPLLKPGGAVFLEIGEGQGRAAAELARNAFPDAAVTVHADLAGLDRIVEIRC